MSNGMLWVWFGPVHALCSCCAAVSSLQSHVWCTNQHLTLPSPPPPLFSLSLFPLLYLFLSCYCFFPFFFLVSHPTVQRNIFSYLSTISSYFTFSSVHKCRHLLNVNFTTTNTIKHLLCKICYQHNHSPLSPPPSPLHVFTFSPTYLNTHQCLLLQPTRFD